MIDNDLKNRYIKFRRAGNNSATTALRLAREDKGRPGSWHGFYPRRSFVMRAGGERFFDDMDIYHVAVDAPEEAHTIVSMRHTGWYTREDPAKDDLYVPCVVKLRGRRGFLACYREECSNGYLVDLSEIHETPEDAARAADNLAERNAEKEREYQEAWQAGQECHDLREEAADERATCYTNLMAWSGVKRTDWPNAVEMTAMRRMAAFTTTLLLRRIRKARNRRDHLAEACALHLRDAFNEGFGETVINEKGWPIYSILSSIRPVETVSTEPVS